MKSNIIWALSLRTTDCWTRRRTA